MRTALLAANSHETVKAVMASCQHAGISSSIWQTKEYTEWQILPKECNTDLLHEASAPSSQISSRSSPP